MGRARWGGEVGASVYMLGVLTRGLTRSLHDIAITNIVWWMAFQREVGGWSYIAQQSCNSIAIVYAMQVGGGNKRRIDSCRNASK